MKLKYLTYALLRDLSNNPLACDCGLIWLIAWSNARDIRLLPAPKCDSPVNFRGMPLKKLKVGIDFRCESLLQPLLELVPKQNQVNQAQQSPTKFIYLNFFILFLRLPLRAMSCS